MLRGRIHALVKCIYWTGNLICAKLNRPLYRDHQRAAGPRQSEKSVVEPELRIFH